MNIDNYNFDFKKINSWMVGLAKHRPVFHSEADFQHALAFYIHKSYPSLQIRLEKLIQYVGYVDIVLGNENSYFLIELKYKTKYDLIKTDSGEKFELRNHGAHPLGRYDAFNDIHRIEKSGLLGASIFLTNDNIYHNCNAKNNGASFSLHEGREVNCIDTLKWNNNEKVGSLGRNRVDPIVIEGSYNFKWLPYGNQKSNFKYLLNMINMPS